VRDEELVYGCVRQPNLTVAVLNLLTTMLIYVSSSLGYVIGIVGGRETLFVLSFMNLG
jgi:hypothetical protein